MLPHHHMAATIGIIFTAAIWRENTPSSGTHDSRTQPDHDMMASGSVSWHQRMGMYTPFSTVKWEDGTTIGSVLPPARWELKSREASAKGQGSTFASERGASVSSAWLRTLWFAMQRLGAARMGAARMSADLGAVRRGVGRMDEGRSRIWGLVANRADIRRLGRGRRTGVAHRGTKLTLEVICERKRKEKGI